MAEICLVQHHYTPRTAQVVIILVKPILHHLTIRNGMDFYTSEFLKEVFITFSDTFNFFR